jgi:hypothetical protein
MRSIIASRQRLRVALGLSTGRPGPHDFTSASMSFVGMIRSRCDPTRPPHPHLAYRDDRAYAPLGEAGWGSHTRFRKKRKRKILALRRGWSFDVEIAREMSFPARAILPRPVRSFAVRSAKLICPTTRTSLDVSGSKLWTPQSIDLGPLPCEGCRRFFVVDRALNLALRRIRG